MAREETPLECFEHEWWRMNSFQPLRQKEKRGEHTKDSDLIDDLMTSTAQHYVISVDRIYLWI